MEFTSVWSELIWFDLFSDVRVWCSLFKPDVLYFFTLVWVWFALFWCLEESNISCYISWAQSSGLDVPTEWSWEFVSRVLSDKVHQLQDVWNAFINRYFLPYACQGGRAEFSICFSCSLIWPCHCCELSIAGSGLIKMTVHLTLLRKWTWCIMQMARTSQGFRMVLSWRHVSPRLCNIKHLYLWVSCHSGVLSVFFNTLMLSYWPNKFK